MSIVRLALVLIKSMSEIEKEFDQLIQNTDPAKLDVAYSPMEGQDMSEELLGVVSAPANDTQRTLRMAPRDGACEGLSSGVDSCQGSPPSLLIMPRPHPALI